MSRYRRDHTPGACHFFTVALADRHSSLLTQNINLLRQSWRRTAELYPFETVAVCILPNHLHVVWRLPPDDPDFSTRWRLIKSGFSRAVPAAKNLSHSKTRQGEKGIWQRRFWEHRIRDERDFQNHVDYIHFNPVKHGLVKASKDWPYSSFHRWVREGRIPEDWATCSVIDVDGED